MASRLARAVVVCCAGCAASPAPPSPQLLRWHAAWASAHELPAASAVLDTPTQWREASVSWPDAIARRNDACRFAVERAVVFGWPGPWAPPLTFTLLEEEDVDVLTVIPGRDATGRSHGIAGVLVVAAGSRPLAIVARAPADAPPAEETLGVFAPR